MKKINPFLWFDSEAEQAAKFYVGIFKNSKIGKITHYGEDGPRPKGSVMTAEFTLDRVDFVALSFVQSAAVRPRGSVCYPTQLASNPDTDMIETNPIHAQIADLRGRVESLRGYL